MYMYMLGVSTYKRRIRELSGIIGKNQFISNTTSQTYFTTDIKPNEIHCKLKAITCTNYYLLCVSIY